MAQEAASERSPRIVDVADAKAAQDFTQSGTSSDPNTRDPSNHSTQGGDAVKTRTYTCPSCNKELSLSVTQILLHKKACKATSTLTSDAANVDIDH